MKILFLCITLSCFQFVSAQNLPSLVTGKNINATFSILAFDSAAKEWGIAVATNNIYVGNSTIYIRPGLGAFSVIAETEPAYALQGFDELKNGKSIQQAIEFTRKKDDDADLRQVSGIDSLGNSYAFTGSTWKYQKGFAGSITGKGWAVMGNQLSDSVLIEMSNTFQKSSGMLAERLLAALVAAQKSGGQITGKQSAALVVKGSNNEWYNNIDLRVDDSKDPFGDLQRLLSYHYGRIRINQAVYAIRNDNKQRGSMLLEQGREMVAGWNGLQDRVALAYMLLNEQSKAVDVILAALKENPKWKENLPAFYMMKDQPRMKGLINENHFSEKEWIVAVSFTGQLNKDDQTVSLCEKALQQFPKSSYLHFLLGKSILDEKRPAEAKKEFQLAVNLDPSNHEAVKMLE